MKTTMRKAIAGLFLLGVLTLISLSCKEIEKLPGEPGNKIIAYKVETAEGILFGAIDNINNTIRVYLPFYFDFEILDPVIELSEGATISGADEPVEVNGTDHVYLVTGKDGSTREYKLSIEVQITKPLWVKATQSVIYLGNNIAAMGNFNTNDPREPEFFVVDEEGVETPFLLSDYDDYSITPMGNNAYIVQGYSMPKHLSLEKLYKIRAKFRGMVADGAEWFQPRQFQPQFRNSAPYVKVKRGDTLTRYTASSTLVEPKRAYFEADGQQHEIEIISWDYEKIEVVIPQNAPLGISYSTRIEFEEFREAQIVYDVIE